MEKTKAEYLKMHYSELESLIHQLNRCYNGSTHEEMKSEYSLRIAIISDVMAIHSGRPNQG